MNDDHLFNAAKICSKNADYSGGNKAQIGCVIAYKGSILAKGWNTNKTHSAQAYYNKWRFKACENNYLPDKCHSEVAALTKIKYLDIDMSKVHIYIYREHKDGSLACARPCRACYAAIKEMGIKNIHYTNEDSYCHEKIVK